MQVVSQKWIGQFSNPFFINAANCTADCCEKSGDLRGFLLIWSVKSFNFLMLPLSRKIPSTDISFCLIAVIMSSTTMGIQFGRAHPKSESTPYFLVNFCKSTPKTAILRSFFPHTIQSSFSLSPEGIGALPGLN